MVSVGSGYDLGQTYSSPSPGLLLNLAGNNRGLVHHVDDYAGLDDLTKEIAKEICDIGRRVLLMI